MATQFENLEVGKNNGLPTQISMWSKVRSFFLQEITVELTPYQKKVEEEVNDFLNQEITFKKICDFFGQEVTLGNKNNKTKKVKF